MVPTLSNLSQIEELSFAPGDKVSDRYLIEERIGRGGMGAVYKAHDSLIDETVALKFMNPRLLGTQRGQSLFIREAQVARRLRHENIVAVHDVSCTNEGILYLSMEFLSGQSLRAFLRKRRKERKFIGVRLAVRLVSQVLAALEYAHRTVIHRDIKPENVMVLAGEAVKVLDFGLAKAIDEAALVPADHSTNPRRVAGTMAYAAPEQKMHHSVDLRADMYAVGLLFRELLTLRSPMDEPAEVVDVRDDVSPSLLAVLYKALLPEKERRWQSAAEFRTSLETAFEESYLITDVAPAQDVAGKKVTTEGMVFLEGGSFLMGNNGIVTEAPEFEAEVEPFYIDTYPVTVQQYAEFLEATGHPQPKFWLDSEFNGPTQPVVGVTWADANAYAAWAGKQLPTEAQWEFAARGKENRKYPWGNFEPDPTRCNYGDHLNMPSLAGMHEAGATPERVHDLAGNVYEWVQEYFLPYQKLRQGPVGKMDAPRRVVRGGSWHSGPGELRCSFRKGVFPEARMTTVGFRCVLPVRPGTKA